MVQVLLERRGYQNLVLEDSRTWSPGRVLRSSAEAGLKCGAGKSASNRGTNMGEGGLRDMVLPTQSIAWFRLLSQAISWGTPPP